MMLKQKSGRKSRGMVYLNKGGNYASTSAFLPWVETAF